MSNKIEKIGKTGINSVLSNPFNKMSITHISVTYRKRSFDLGWIAEGEVRFENGKTKAEQSFTGDSFDNVTTQIKHFIENEL